MMEHPILLFLDVLVDVVIAFAYLALAFVIMRRVDGRQVSTRFGGVGFFALGSLAQLVTAYEAVVNSEMALGTLDTSWYMLAIHIPQAICVILVIGGLYVEPSSHANR